MLVYLQQNWIKDQHELQETLSTITIEKARIEEDTNSWTFPRNVTSTTATITAASSLRGRGYEATWLHGSASKSCIRRFVITEKAPIRHYANQPARPL